MNRSFLSCLYLLLLAFVPRPGPEVLVVRRVVVPEYPPLARMARLQGSVTVDVEINGKGEVVSARASGGDPILQRAAEGNARLWTYGLAPQSGSFPLKHTVTYVYVLAREGGCPKVEFNLPDRVQISQAPSELQPSGSTATSKRRGGCEKSSMTSR
jgi:TonB family protein